MSGHGRHGGRGQHGDRGGHGDRGDHGDHRGHRDHGNRGGHIGHSGHGEADGGPHPVPGAPSPDGPDAPGYGHAVLKSLLGAWALAACSPEETAAVEAHLTDCAPCADEAVRLRDAVGLLHAEDSLDLDPGLRSQVLEGCLDRRPARIPVPHWAAPYEAETARLDALLRDMADEEWRAPVRLRWFDGEGETEREATVAQLLGHLYAVDGAVAAALGLPDPLAGPGGPRSSPERNAGPIDLVHGPVARTEAYWALDTAAHHSAEARTPWREQSRAVVRHVSYAQSDATGDAAGGARPGAAGSRRRTGPSGGARGGGAVGEAGNGTGAGDRSALPVGYGEFTLPLHDALLDRAFECWKHAEDIADAVDYPYGPPVAAHLNLLVDLAARRLPDALAGRRRAGLAGPPGALAPAGAPGRTLRLEVEGEGGGDWYVPLDSPAARPSPDHQVAHVALDTLEFCQLAAGHVPPLEAAVGEDGDREAIREVLYAVASLSRL